MNVLMRRWQRRGHGERDRAGNRNSLEGCYNRTIMCWPVLVAEAMNNSRKEPWTQGGTGLCSVTLDGLNCSCCQGNHTKKYGTSADTHLYTGPGQVTCFNNYGSTDEAGGCDTSGSNRLFLLRPAPTWGRLPTAGSLHPAREAPSVKRMIYAAR